MAAAEEPPPEDFDAFFDAEAEPDAEPEAEPDAEPDAEAQHGTTRNDTDPCSVSPATSAICPPAAYTFELADVVETLQLARGIENTVTTIDNTTVSTRDRVTDLAYLVKTLQEQLEGIDGNVSMLKTQNVVLSVEHHNLHRAVAVLSEEARKLHRAVMALVRRAEGQSAEGHRAEGQRAEGQRAEGQSAEGQRAEGQSAKGQKESPNPHNF